MMKRWPVLAQILIALGCGGGIISAWVGVNQKNMIIVGLGLLTAGIFWFFYQLKPWAQHAVNGLLAVLIFTDGLSVILKEVNLSTGVMVMIFRGLILYYFNTKEIKALFEISPGDEENA
jgi:hypothetical protein